jgi:hypothetical protein
MAPEEKCESEMFVWVRRAGCCPFGAIATIVEEPWLPIKRKIGARTDSNSRHEE